MSNQIDERVVRMTFDNKKFEQNAKTTMSTLDSLKNKLNFKGAVQGVNEINKVAGKLNFTPITRGVEEVQSKFSALQVVGITALSNLTTAAMNAGRTLISKISSPLIQGGINRALNIEAARFQIKGLGKDWDKLYEDMDYAVSGTAYGLDVAAKAAAQFSSSGIEAGDDMKAALRAISGVAAMTNSSYEDISRIFTGIAGQNRVMGNDLLQLSGRGMNAAANLGEQLGKTEVEIRTMVTKGQIDFKTFAKAMDQAFGEHATEANKTYTGSLSNLKAAFAKIGQKVASPGLDNLRDVFNSIRKVINDVHLALDPEKNGKSGVIGDINNFQTAIAQGIVKFVDLGGLRNIIDGIGNIFTALWKVIDPIRKALMDIIPTPSIEQLVGFTEGFKNLTQSLNDFAIDPVVSVIQDKINQLVEFVKNFYMATTWGRDGFMKWASETGLLSNSIGKFAEKIQDFVMAITEGIDVSGSLNAALEGLGEGFSWIGKLLGALTSVFSLFVSAVSNTMEHLTENIVNLTGAAGSGVQGFVELIFKILELIPEGVSKVVASIGHGLSDILDAVPISEILSIIKDLLSVSIMTNINAFTKDMLTAGKSFFHIFDGLLDIVSGVTGVLDSVKDSIKAFTTGIKIKQLLQIAIAIGILAFSLRVLAEVPADQLAASLGVLVGGLIVMGAVIVALSAAMKKVNKGAGDLLGFNDAITQLIKVAAAMFIFAHAIKVLTEAMTVLAGLSWNEIVKGLAAISGMSLVLIGVSRLLGSAKGLIKASASLIIFSFGVKFMAEAFEKFNDISWDTLAKGLITFAGSMLIIAEAMNIMSGKTKGIISTSLSMIAVGFAMQLLADAIKSFNDIEVSSVAKGLAVMTAFMGVVNFMARSKTKLKGAISQILLMTFIAASMNSMMDIIRQFDEINPDSVKKFAIAVIAFYGGIKAFLGSFTEKDMARFFEIAGGMWSISEGLKVIASTIKDFGYMDTEQLVKGVSSMFLILISMSKAMQSMTSPGSIASAGFAFIALGIAMRSISRAVTDFGSMDTEQLAKGLLAFVLSLKVLTKSMSSMAKSTGSVIKGSAAMILMAMAITMLVAPIKTLGTMSLGDIAKGILGLAAAMIVIGVAATAFGNMTGTILKTAASLAVMGLAIMAFGIGLTAIIYPLKSLAGMNVADMASSIAGLGGIILALVAVTKTIEKLPNISVKSLAKLAILAAVIALVGFIVSQLASIDALAALEASLAISAVILSAGGALALLSVVPLVGAVKALAALVIVIGGMAAVVTAMGAIAQIPGAKWIVSEGAAFMRSIGEAIGGMIGGLAGGIAGGAIAGVGAVLPAFGVSLSEFAVAASPFFSQMRSFNSSSMEGVKSLVEMVLMITAASFLNSVTSFLMGGSSLSSFAVQLIPFGRAITEYSKAVEGINPAAIMLSAQAGKALAKLAQEIPATGGLWQVFSGNQDLAAFGKQLGAFGRALKAFSLNTKDIEVEPIAKASEAGKYLTDLAKSLPETGGLWQVFSGEHDLKSFAKTLVPFGKALKEYSDEVTDVKPEPILASASAAKALTEVAQALPETGGLAQWFSGSKDLGEFAYYLKPFGEAMKQYSDAVVDVKPEAVEASANAAKALSELVNTLPNTDGVVQVWFGRQNFSSITEGLVPFGRAIRLYSKAVDGVKPTAIMASTIAGKALVSLLESLPKEGGLFQAVDILFGGERNIGSIARQLIPFGVAMKKFSRVVTGIDVAAVTASGIAGKALAMLLNALPRDGGAIEWIIGSSTSLSAFARELVPFGVAMKDYSMVVKGIDTASIIKSTMGALAITKVMKALPRDDSIADIWLGKPGSLGAFAKELVPFGIAMKIYSLAVKGIDSDAISQSASAGTALVEMAKGLAKEEGVVQWWEGSSTKLDEFGKQLATFGSYLAIYSMKVKGIDSDKVSASAEAAKRIVEFVNEMPKHEGIFEGLDGVRMTLGELGEQLKEFGPAMKEFSDAVGGENPINSEQVSAVAESAKLLVELANSLSENSNDRLSGFSGILKDLGAHFKEYYDETKDINSETSDNTTRALEAIVELCQKIPETISTTPLNEFKDSLRTVGTDALTEFINALSDGTQNVIDAVTNLATTIRDTIEANTDLMKTAFRLSAEASMNDYANGINNKIENPCLFKVHQLMEKVVDVINLYAEKFEKAGENDVDGYVRGMDKNNYKAALAGARLAKKAMDAVKHETDQHSPSKAYTRIAKYDVMGYAKGFSKYSSLAENSASKVAHSTMDSLRKAINVSAMMAENELDFSPTITPILDLSSVESQSGKLNGMLSGKYAVPIDKISLNAAKAIPIQNGSDLDLGQINNPTGDIYNFTQNNYSPKALSRTEIYRDTKSQFALARRSIKK